MVLVFPCEKVKWTILPAVRKELSLYLINVKNLERKKVCELLGLTPSALSQYIKGKRANSVELIESDVELVHELGDFLTRKKFSEEKFFEFTCRICKKIKKRIF